MRNSPLRAFTGDNKKKKKYTTKENLEHMMYLRWEAGNKLTKDDNIKEIYSQIRGDKSV